MFAKLMTHQLVLVGGYGSEHGLREDVGPELLLIQVLDGAAMLTPLYQMNAGLVAVHRVQYDLQHQMFLLVKRYIPSGSLN